jgi:cyanophycin synthetase
VLKRVVRSSNRPSGYAVLNAADHRGGHGGELPRRNLAADRPPVMVPTARKGSGWCCRRRHAGGDRINGRADCVRNVNSRAALVTQVDNAMAAVAAAWAVGVHWEALRSDLASL